MINTREIQYLRWYEQVVFEKEIKETIEKKKEKDIKKQKMLSLRSKT